MKPFRERNPVTIGLLGFALIATMILAAFRADELPLIGGGDAYYANFSEIGGLRPGDEVRIAGVAAGKVKSYELQGDHVRVEFTIDKGVGFGPESGAAIKVRTLLGAMYLGVTPVGSGQMKTGTTIPVDRTVAPYDVVDAFSDLAETTEAIDIPQLKEALDTLSGIAERTPEEFQGAIRGFSAVSSNLAARDEQINALLVGLKKVTAVLNSRDDELVTLFKDSDVLFRALSERRDSIHNLLVATVKFSVELRGLVKDTRADLKPTLDQLQEVVTVLRKNEASIDEGLRIFGPFLTVFGNALGNGPWFDTYVAGMPPNLGVADQLKDALGDQNPVVTP